MSRTAATFHPPIPEARRWLDGVTFPPDRPLINLSQAAPVEPPPRALREAMAGFLGDPSTHLYGSVLGNDELRAGLARNWAAHYGAPVGAERVAITSGCNQAFAAAVAALCDQGDEIILPTPWYFNHKMWLDMNGMRAVPLPVGADMLPDAEAARALIGPRTRAIAIVTPNNPAGVEYPPATVAALFEVAREAGIRLIIDETYRDFDARTGAPHDLLTRPGRDETLVQLYSFSKAYRLTGHRVGALIGSPALLDEAEKFLDTVTICPAQLGQRAALWGLENLDDWLAGERAEILTRRAAIVDGMARIEPAGWRLKGLGAYFAYLEHPFAMSSAEAAPRMVRDAGILMLPGTMFVPEGDAGGARHFRMAFANADAAGLAGTFDRLAALDWPLAGPQAGR
ncbi:aminotransferase [Citreimonas salinaria]|uniref:aspartate transaminase n=1 Tax=Citreimonas salinaria TaxID=321339 RepID=A0A1H3H641_9RHOB|nr:aminotransferase [Citreimonas salinaria]SDY10685.1 Aspartate/methionine/tyrosine aminotransferase [Citreimonas salinaria]